MKKISLLVISILFAILLLSPISFANNEVKNGIHSVTDTVVDGVERMGEDIRNGISNAENTIENGASAIGTAVTDGVNDMATDTYTATRTSASDVTTGNNDNAVLWTWIIVAVAAAVIIGLVWYYATQNAMHH